MTLRRVGLLLSIVTAGVGCSSSDTGAAAGASSVDSGTGSCSSDPAAAADRASCKFQKDAPVADTLGACAPAGSASPVRHVVLLMMENRSFDHYLGHLKGNGQDDVDVADPAASNPGANGGPAVPWHHADYCFDDTNHEWPGTHLEWNNGQMDGFVAQNAGANDMVSEQGNSQPGTDPTGARAMGYYDQTDIPFYYALASTFATSDRYFCDLLGPTYPNRMYYYAASSNGLVSNQFDTATDRRTVFTALNEAGVSWKVYKSDAAGALIEASFSTDSSGKVGSIDEFATDAAADMLPDVTFLDPQLLTGLATQTSEHPPGDPQVGQKFVYDQVEALMNSPSWPSSVMFITYDEHGGLYNHVNPPAACPPDDVAPQEQPELGGFDRYGVRVPVFAVSPFAKKNYVSHVTHSHASLVRFVSWRFDLPALTARDANSDAMLDLFDFDNPPFVSPPSFDEPPVDQAKLADCVAKFGQ